MTHRPSRWAGVMVLAIVGVVMNAASGCLGADQPIRLAYSGAPDFDMIPAVEAHAELAADGLPVEVVHYARSELAVEAVARGDADVGHGSVRNYWAAASRGAPVRLVMAHTGNVHRLVAYATIVHCSALDGRNLAVQSEGAVGTALLRAFLAEECPDALPAHLYVPQSANRGSALLADGVRAAVLEVPDAVLLDRLAPGRFRVLADFGVRWGDVLTSGVFVNASWAEAHPDRVRRYVRARVAANRRATDPVALAARAAQILGESDHWGAVAETYVASGYWPDDGGLTNELVDRSLTFFTRHGSLPGDLDADRAADVSFLTDALAELAAFPRERPGK